MIGHLTNVKYSSYDGNNDPRSLQFSYLESVQPKKFIGGFTLPPMQRLMQVDVLRGKELVVSAQDFYTLNFLLQIWGNVHYYFILIRTFLCVLYM